jgi:hypothetical protein
MEPMETKGKDRQSEHMTGERLEIRPYTPYCVTCRRPVCRHLTAGPDPGGVKR